MIKIQAINKYYNKGKAKEICACNDISMELPNCGIVSFLGPSGCGKTTLLNVISGLDKVNSGSIFVNNQQITKKSDNKIDNIRNSYIGYVFQNYCLINDKTVKENVSIALKMVGFRDENEINARVNYCLEKIGIYKIRNKKVSELSGGQQQRVAIARAIVKNPLVIIADEPTGNLDSNNTIQIMNILKAISKEKLVVVVTHEQKIAEYYSDYICEIKDGKIIEMKSNDSSNFLDYQFENKIFLKDMQKEIELSSNDCKIKIFGDDNLKANIRIALRNGNLYIDSDEKYQIIDGRSDVEMIDDYYKSTDSIYRNNDFDCSAFIPDSFRPKYSSINKIASMIPDAWKRIGKMKKTKKLFLVSFTMAAIFIFISVSNIMGTINIKPEKYLRSNTHYLNISNPKKDEELLNVVKKMEGVKYVIPGNSKVSVGLPLEDYYQTVNVKKRLNVSITCSDVLRRWDIIIGDLPRRKKDIVIDKMVVDSFLDSGQGKIVGLDSADKMIGRKIVVSRAGEYNIVGISDTEDPSLYAKKSEIIGILSYAGLQIENDGINAEYGGIDETIYDDTEDYSLSNVIDLKFTKSKIKLIEGVLPHNKYDVIASISDKDYYKLGEKISENKILNHSLKVVGFYSSAEEDYSLYTTTETATLAYIADQNSFSAYCDNPKQTKTTLEELGVASKVAAEAELDKYISDRKDYSRTSLIAGLIIFIISFLEMFFILRSSMLSRIYEIGTLRAIGVKKKDIYKMFIGEIVLITFLTAIPGIAISYYLLYQSIKAFEFLNTIILIKPLLAIGTFAIILLFNVIAGLLPVAILLRKKPAQILSREDVQ